MACLKSLILCSITVNFGFSVNINGTSSLVAVQMNTTSNIYHAATSAVDTAGGLSESTTILLCIMGAVMALCGVCCLLVGIYIGVIFEKRSNLTRIQTNQFDVANRDDKDAGKARKTSASTSVSDDTDAQQVCIDMNADMEHDSGAHVNVHVPGSLPPMSYAEAIPLPMSMIVAIMDAPEESRSNESLYDHGEEEEEKKLVDLETQARAKHMVVNSDSAMSTTTGQNVTAQQPSESSIVDPGDTNRYVFDNVRGKVGEQSTLSWQQSTISPNRAHSIQYQNSHNSVIYPAEGNGSIRL
mmetsp:Transcript_4554/g.7587  ORF Transcript_4554/g.7587 Transcript_4554/m.7587 type:complete len:298 (-) Transcript_4554:263-1156(-)